MYEEIENLNVSVASLVYYLYRQAGTPLGDNTSGMVAWLDIQKDLWRDLIEPNLESKDDN